MRRHWLGAKHLIEGSFPMESLRIKPGPAIVAVAITCILCCAAHASGSAQAGNQESLSKVLLALVVILIAAKIGGDVLVRLGQPAILGELIFGIIVGNLYLFGFHGFEFIKNDESVRILSEIGVALLLFQVGLESDLAKMMKVGSSALTVATLGQIASFLLGWGVVTIFMPDANIYVRVFIGASLCATSVGITARVLLDLGWIQTAEARIILGAAVIDDVQGLVVLAVVVGIISAANAGTGSLSATSIVVIVAKAAGFLAGALIIGRWLSPRVFRMLSRLRAADVLIAAALGMCFGFAYLASLIGLAPIVGAFAAGLILEEVHWRKFKERGEHSVLELIKPLAAFLVPIFFVRMGARVELATFAKPAVLGLAGALTLAAVVSKQVCGLGVLQKGLDRVSVGIGMIPRGEVGLICASIGSTLICKGQRVIVPATYSAIVIVVVVTTMITPPALKWSINRGVRLKKLKEQAAEAQEQD